MEKQDYDKKYKEWVEELRANPKKLLKQAKEFAGTGKKKKDIEMEAFGSYFVAASLFQCGMSADMLKYAVIADTYYSSVPSDIQLLLRVKSILAIAYSTVGDYTNSLKKNLETMEIIKKNRLRDRRTVGINNIALDYSMLGENKTAIRMLKKEYNSYCKRKRQKPDLLHILTYNLSDLYYNEGNIGQAEYYLGKTKEQVALLGEMMRRFSDCRLQSLEAKICYAKGENDKANELADKVYESIQNGFANFELNGDYEKLSLYQIKIGEYDRADKFADFLWKYAEETKISTDIIRAARLQAIYFDTIGEKERALHFYRSMVEENDRWVIRQRKVQLEHVKIIEEAKALIEKMRWEAEEKEIMSGRDALTKLLNRSAFTRLLERSVEEAKRKNICLGCVFLDVDNFKLYNDTYGHLVGDEVLRELGKVFLALEKENIYSIRYGGDEFFGLLVGYKDEDVRAFAEALAEKVRRIRLTHDGRELETITASVGVINLKLREDFTIMDVVKYSDDAMYYSKEAGKNRICMFHMDPQADDGSGVFEILKEEI